MSQTGFTAIPNDILDCMSELSPAEFKALMAVYRLIVGYKEYRKERRRRLSLNYLKDFTGLSKQGIINAMDALTAKGYISKIDTDGTNEWVVNSVDQPEPEGSQESVPVVNSVDQGSQLSVPGVVNSVDQPSLSKEREEKKKGKEENPFPFQPNPATPANVPEVERRIDEILAACDFRRGTPAHLRRAESAAAQIQDISPEEIRARYGRASPPNGSWHWYRDDWRGKKGEPPKPETILETIYYSRQETTAGGQTVEEIISNAVDEVMSNGTF